MGERLMDNFEYRLGDLSRGASETGGAEMCIVHKTSGKVRCAECNTHTYNGLSDVGEYHFMIVCVH